MLPESTADLLMLRPVGGLDEEVTGVLPGVEPVESATFRLPGREDLGDFTSGLLLRDAARLSTRTAAGPFRSFGRIAVEPRPYQLVPLMMALKLDPVRTLVADDVGIGKTIEACLIARELLDRGEIRRIAVLCPPHLAEQWQRELEDAQSIGKLGTDGNEAGLEETWYRAWSAPHRAGRHHRASGAVLRRTEDLRHREAGAEPAGCPHRAGPGVAG